MNLIGAYFKKQDESDSTTTAPTGAALLPCPGLQEARYEKIGVYLDRTGALGGGAPSVSAIAHELFGKRFRKLSVPRKKQVKLAQKHEWLWHNDHGNGTVFSASCMKVASDRRYHDPNRPWPCWKCQSLLSTKTFQNLIRISPPPDENYKYINMEYRNEWLGSLYGRSVGLREIMEVRSYYPNLNQDTTNNPLIKYTKGVISGKYQGNDLFGTLLQAVVVKRDKEQRGVGIQNFKYAPELIEFAHIVHTHSPRAYETIKEFLPVPSPRTLLYVDMQRGLWPKQTTKTN
ncbi:hypothetical protein BD779DRAFT_1448231 [Infundibulicybe gibba]|nr:hypothetical protein BD779DRAFT_1448231 [Infundibulicybe gibba]